ncbi:hypothetical protein Intca_2078 [Intrasporangium calvum DSM 43043]|uniref:Uncharacterized protein n=2 Tax=Intrasporangium calvum TaxID=53358 RepID=E6SD00_INTC7|nr:hypothetical protein Intca_2078 [Intrasporangium calvum DSM 43043]
MATKQGTVACPTKSTEWVIKYATSQARNGWTDMCATQKNALTDAWDYLTKKPLADESPHGRLKGDLATVTRSGVSHDRRQYELKNGARIWYWVEGQTVMLERVETHHPNATKKRGKG